MYEKVMFIYSFITKEFTSKQLEDALLTIQ